MTNKAVILAAGRGGRLDHHTKATAKCLVRLAGRPLIDYVLEALAKGGVREAVIVAGYEGEQVEAYLCGGERFGLRLHYAWNREYARGNASSLSAALPLVAGEPFLLCMSDHICSASLVRDFLEFAGGRSAIAVDSSDLGAARIEEATKVALLDGIVTDVGKQLEPWDAVDTGFSHWSAGAFAPDSSEHDGELAALMTSVARTEGGLAACDIGGRFWFDIDTDEDIQAAERLLRADERILD